jgi:hypothetical protein
MFETNCHCGNVQVNANEYPENITMCNCSICHRYGALWAYYVADQVTVVNGDLPVSSYQWGQRRITFHSCGNCGCVTHYTCIREDGTHKVGINTRMAAPGITKNIAVRLFDGADSWKYINEQGN